MNEFGEQIKRLRRLQKMSQTELAGRLNITKSAVSAYENNNRRPSYNVLIHIAEIFNVSVDNLLGKSNESKIDVTGLTDSQRNTIQSVVMFLRNDNSSSNNTLEDVGLRKPL